MQHTQHTQHTTHTTHKTHTGIIQNFILDLLERLLHEVALLRSWKTALDIKKQVCRHQHQQQQAPESV
jgi:hypothetical protein